jgi:hypothetical protein
LNRERRFSSAYRRETAFFRAAFPIPAGKNAKNRSARRSHGKNSNPVRNFKPFRRLAQNAEKY